MPNMQPLRREDHPELEALFRHYDETLSFVPNSLPLIGIVSSIASGCRYCQVHEAVDARERGVPDEKIAQIWNFERSNLYDEGEREALRFARDASLVPNEVTPDHFQALRLHWDDGQTEGEPTANAHEHFGDHWDPGKHAG